MSFCCCCRYQIHGDPIQTHLLANTYKFLTKYKHKYLLNKCELFFTNHKYMFVCDDSSFLLLFADTNCRLLLLTTNPSHMPTPSHMQNICPNCKKYLSESNYKNIQFLGSLFLLLHFSNMVMVKASNSISGR